MSVTVLWWEDTTQVLLFSFVRDLCRNSYSKLLFRFCTFNIETKLIGKVLPHLFCERCGEVCRDMVGIYEHIYEVHKNAEMWYCPCCIKNVGENVSAVFKHYEIEMKKDSINKMRIDNFVREYQRMSPDKFLFYCMKCGGGYNDIKELMGHSEVCYPDENFACIYCSTQRKDFSSLLVHFRMSHLNSTIKYKHKCDECNVIIPLTQNFKQHQIQVHGVNRFNLRFPCRFCNVDLRSVDDFNKHMTLHVKRKIFRCCSIRYDNFHEYNNHKISKHPEMYNLCNICKTQILKSEFPTHVVEHKVHTEGRITCCDCRKNFAQIDFYFIHKKSCRSSNRQSPALRVPTINHLNNRSCTKCNIVLESGFLQHMIDHRIKDEGSIECMTCSKTFVESSIYVKHLQTPEDCKKDGKSKKKKSKQVSCIACQKIFTDHDEVMEHISMHSLDVGNKQCSLKKELLNQICYVCDFQFIGLVESHRHLLSDPSCQDQHRIPPRFRCSICQRRFKYPTGLEDHTRTVHGKLRQLPLFPCNSCPVVFSSKQELEGHTKIHSILPINPSNVLKLVPLTNLLGKNASNTNESYSDFPRNRPPTDTQSRGTHGSSSSGLSIGPSKPRRSRWDNPSHDNSKDITSGKTSSASLPETLCSTDHCQQCSDGFDDKMEFKRHMQLMHSDIPSESGENVERPGYTLFVSTSRDLDFQNRKRFEPETPIGFTNWASRPQVPVGNLYTRRSNVFNPLNWSGSRCLQCGETFMRGTLNNHICARQ